MSVFGAVFDKYVIMARQRPALLMLLPGLVGAVVLFPSLRSWWATLLAVTGTCGVSMALGEFAQARGKALEPTLISLWGGLPSVAMLRHRDTRLDVYTKGRYKTFLQKVVPGLVFPDAAEEEANTAGADAAYQSATKWLLTQTRDKRVNSLLFESNISYGFRRNMLGLRRFGVLVSVITLVVTVGYISRAVFRADRIEDTLMVSLIVGLTALWFWIGVVKPAWVEIAANGYARELLAACDKLAGAAGPRISAKAVAG